MQLASSIIYASYCVILYCSYTGHETQGLINLIMYLLCPSVVEGAMQIMFELYIF